MAHDQLPYRMTTPFEGVVMIENTQTPLGALSGEDRNAILAVLERLDNDPTVRAVVFTGGEDHFSVGSNIKKFEHTREWLEQAWRIEAGLNEFISKAGFISIAACRGHTLGGGCVFAVSCDFRISGKSARFGFPEVGIGAFATALGTQLLPQLVGRGQALRLLTTGMSIEASEAFQIGLVEELVDDNEVVSRSLDLAGKIASVSGAAVRSTKLAVRAGIEFGIEAGKREELLLTISLGLSDDAVEGRLAFLEKRKPTFKE